MTSSNRSKQVYFTLKTIEKCSFKNIHVIIVDDSDVDPINKEYINKYLNIIKHNGTQYILISKYIEFDHLKFPINSF